MKPQLPTFLLITDDRRKPDPVAEARQLSRGQGLVFRHYTAPLRREYASSLSRLDWRLADRVGAVGIHLPEGYLRSGLLAPLLGWARRRHRLVTAACHNRMALGRAQRLGCSAALISPVFATASHADAQPLGLTGFCALSRTASIAVYGLGGMRQKNADYWTRRTRSLGVAGTIPLKSRRRAGTKQP
jgi:thiamine-phosphate pyrophosphorylase